MDDIAVLKQNKLQISKINKNFHQLDSLLQKKKKVAKMIFNPNVSFAYKSRSVGGNSPVINTPRDKKLPLKKIIRNGSNRNLIKTKKLAEQINFNLDFKK